MQECNHCKENGHTAIVFGNHKWTGVYPFKVKGICTICKQKVELNEKEYRNLLK